MRSSSSMSAAVIELRSYPMKPLGRDSFIDNFEAHYLEEMERFGAIVMGQFRVMDDPDRFVWFRGFSDLTLRAPSLRAFYSGEVWNRHGPISVALFVRPLTVRLLRPLDSTDLTAGTTLAATLSAFASGTCSVETGVVVVDIFRVAESHRRDEVAEFLRATSPALESKASELRGLLVAEERNDSWEEEVIRDVREVVLVTVHRDRAAAERHAETVANLTIQIGGDLTGPPTSMALLPTIRSAMRYR
jgi:hypothetical protein